MLWNIDSIKILHVEPTSRCNLSCPQCARNILGEQLNPDIKIGDLPVSWFESLPTKFIHQLHKIYFCGDFGDPCANNRLLDIIKYLKSINHDLVIGINTNGSIRNTQWWRDCAKLLRHPEDFVMFAIDGLEDTNHIYRKNSNWNKIIENVKAFIDAGGNALWEYLVFQHNKHQVSEAKQLAKDMGFNWFNTKVTRRFKDKTVDYIKAIEENETHNYEQMKISCETLHKNEIYVSADGLILPCCHIGEELFDWSKKHNRKNLVDALGGDLEMYKLTNKSLEDIINSFNKVSDTWLLPDYKSGKLPVCAETCGLINNKIITDTTWKERMELNALNG